MQEQRCRQFARLKGWSVTAVYVERGVSGRLAQRPELDRLQSDVAALEATAPVATIVYSLSRLGRSVGHLHELFERLRVVSVTESWDMTTASGQLIVGILSSVAEFEGNLIKERTANALAQIKAEGRHVGRPPIGWMINETGHLVRDENKWPIVDGVFRQYRSNHSKASIARFFDLQPKQVQRILEDERNVKEFERRWPATAT
jgi:DNA invertase Pin-like site-specific DNA recombinase